MLALGGSGCIENMADLKEALGVVEPVAPLAHEPVVAVAQAETLEPRVGVLVRFASEGSHDPAGLPLTYVWEFGDGAIASGERALHAFSLAGAHVVRLTVTSAAGVKADDTLALDVRPLDLAPTVALRILDDAGASASRATIGERLTFEAVASDPEGGALAYAWELGDGNEAQESDVVHAYEAPGVYEIRLTATDALDQSGTASARLLVDGAWRAAGAFEAAGASSAEVPFVVPAGAREVTATLRYPAGLGMNDVEVALLDASAMQVGASAGATPPGAQGEQTRGIALGAEGLAGAKSGAWTARVVKEGGLGVAWTIEIRVTM